MWSKIVRPSAVYNGLTKVACNIDLELLRPEAVGCWPGNGHEDGLGKHTVQSADVHGPPVSARILAFTARI